MCNGKVRAGPKRALFLLFVLYGYFTDFDLTNFFQLPSFVPNYYLCKIGVIFTEV